MSVPLAMVSGVTGAAETEVTRPQVSAGTAMQTGSPQALVHVLAAAPHQPPPRPAADNGTEGTES